ncbi:hypothetical protein [Lunatimonas salinarum]|uniref:hypothetical protein n=1 Tax=Lunatimonas salinarum TaxID=1774590 RepID=UPI001AE02473|nr:hypothetical protein [Lunatimonas salinarum]
MAGTEKPANYTPYRFGHSVSTSFAVYTSRHLQDSSPMLTIPMTPPHLTLVRNRYSSQNPFTGYIVRIAPHNPVARNARIHRLLVMEHKV